MVGAAHQILDDHQIKVAVGESRRGAASAAWRWRNPRSRRGRGASVSLAAAQTSARPYWTESSTKRTRLLTYQLTASSRSTLSLPRSVSAKRAGGPADRRIFDLVPARIERRAADAKRDGAENVGAAVGDPGADHGAIAKHRGNHRPVRQRGRSDRRLAECRSGRRGERPAALLRDQRLERARTAEDRLGLAERLRRGRRGERNRCSGSGEQADNARCDGLFHVRACRRTRRRHG